MIAAFAPIIGQQRALGRLALALEHPSHAYLFVGPAGVGKRTVAMAWTRALLCDRRTGCGRCSECLALDHDNHPDFHRWKVLEGKKQTTIEQVREIVRQAELAPYRSSYQVHLLWADTLNTQSANCLLKTLEEPPPRTILILLGQSLSDLLPTVVSRCQRIPFAQVPVETLSGWLVDRHGIEPGRAQAAARRSGGSVRKALAIATEPEVPATRLLFIRDLLEALAEAEAISEQPSDVQLRILEDLIDQIRDALIWQATGSQEGLSRPQHDQHLIETGRSTAKWHVALRQLENARLRLVDSANARLLWTVLAADLAGLRVS